MNRRSLLVASISALLASQALPREARCATPPKPKTRNVILVMADGLRWQELFRGADPALMNKEHGNVGDLDAVRKEFWRDNPTERRAALMPFMWSVIAREGQLYGNVDAGSVARVTNGKNFSFPGYNETLAGFADDRINSNDKIPNPNRTVFEWLHGKPEFKGRVAAFGSWDVFPWIFNRERCGFPVNAGYEPVSGPRLSGETKLINRIMMETPRMWGNVRYDSLTFYAALDHLKTQRPRLLYISLGETDEFGHEGHYDRMLYSARTFDGFLKTLWETLQAMPEYRNKTTLLVTTDHGRGEAPTEWRHHGGIAGTDRTWIAAMGPDTPPLGERKNVETVTADRIAATLAAFLGHDYNAAEPKAGKPIAAVIRGKADDKS